MAPRMQAGQIRGNLMLQHLRVLALATATLMGLGHFHSVAAKVRPMAAPSAEEQLETAPVRLVTSASVRAIAVGY